MKTKKKKYIGNCDNPRISGFSFIGSIFEGRPVIFKGDYSRNGAYHLRNDNYVTEYQYPSESLESFKIMYPDKI